MMPLARLFCNASLAAALALGAGPVNDGTIYDQVRIRLASDREAGRTAIDVTVRNGVVQLQGVVRNEKTRGRAEKLAKKVKGVQRVENNLRISATDQK